MMCMVSILCDCHAALLLILHLTVLIQLYVSESIQAYLTNFVVSMMTEPNALALCQMCQESYVKPKWKLHALESLYSCQID